MASNWPTQCLVLLKRSWRESTRDYAKLGGGIGGAGLISGITCALFSEMGSDLTKFSAVQNRYVY